MRFEIRDAQLADVGSVLALWKAADATESVTDGPEALEHVVGRDYVAFLVAEHEGKVVGSVIGTFDGWRGNVYRLAVHPKHRRLGLARKLLDALHERFSSWDVERVTALVEKSHPLAVGFWDSTSYEHDPRMIRYVRTMRGDDTDRGV